jgi:hypothetical protein
MIEQFTTGMSFDDFRVDPKTVAAVERKYWRHDPSLYNV